MSALYVTLCQRVDNYFGIWETIEVRGPFEARMPAADAGNEWILEQGGDPDEDVTGEEGELSFEVVELKR